MFPMINASTNSTSSSDTELTPISLPRISLDEYSEIENHIVSVIALLHDIDLHRLQNVFHRRACNAGCLQEDIGSVAIIEASADRAVQALSYLQSSRLRSKNLFLSQFLHHDILGSLNTIMSYFRLLQECPDDPSYYPHIATMYPTVQDAEWFMASFVSSMKFWVDPSLVVPSPIPLEPLIQHSIFCVTGRDRAMPIVHLPRDFTVKMHEGILGVLLVNIFKNALGRGGASEIDVKSEQIGDDQIRLCISDNGRGVPDELVSKIFELGVSGVGSTGIGLGAARERLAPSGATIECEPHGGLPSKVNPGQFGAKFVIDMSQVKL